MQTALLKYDINHIFKELPNLCIMYDYTIKQIDAERKTITAKKGNIFFNTILELELRVIKLDNDILNIGVKILKKGVPQKDLEEKFIDSIYKLF